MADGHSIADDEVHEEAARVCVERHPEKDWQLMANFNIEAIKQALTKSFDFGNLYTVKISKLQGISTIYACKVSTPGLGIEAAQNGITGSGQMIVTPGKQTNEDLKITFYNTGAEYNAVYNYKKSIYNPDTNSFGYHYAIITDITVQSFTRTGTSRQIMSFKDCVLSSMGGLDFAFNADNVQTFDTSWAVKSMSHNI
jgi:hypothetical protein